MKIVGSVESKDKLYVDCGCFTEGIAIEVDKEHKEFNFAYFEYGFTGKKLTIQNRIRHAWKLLTTGFPYTDMVILSSNVVSQISDFIRVKLAEMHEPNSSLIIQKLTSPAFTVVVNSEEKSEVEAAFEATKRAMFP